MSHLDSSLTFHLQCVHFAQVTVVTLIADGSDAHVQSGRSLRRGEKRRPRSWYYADAVAWVDQVVGDLAVGDQDFVRQSGIGKRL